MGDVRTFGEFTAGRLLGEGALCSVFRAENAGGRVVAIKTLKPSIPPSSPLAAQLKREAEALGALTHPNIVALLDRESGERCTWLALELVDGPNLAEVLAKRPRLTPAAAAALGAEVARALAHVHQRGWVHHDVKPGNVLFTSRGEVKLIDFGIGARAGQNAGNETLDPHFGTPAYMAPEQILGERADARSDLFALGVVLYQAVAGVRPFEGRGEERRAAGQQIRRDPPVPLRRHAPEAPPALERLVLALLEKHPGDRPQRAAAVAERLEAIAVEASRRSNAASLRATLASAGFPVETTDDVVLGGVEVEAFLRMASVRRLAAQLGSLTVGAALAAALVLSVGRAPGEPAGAVDRGLDLRPSSAGGLRVLATPWAEVFVDGVAVETTPFAQAISLTAGRHFVSLRHPTAPEENREVLVISGETVTLDVTMGVR